MKERERRLRNGFIKRSGRMRALNILAKRHPDEFQEVLIEGEDEAMGLYDSLDVLFQRITSEVK